MPDSPYAYPDSSSVPPSDQIKSATPGPGRGGYPTAPHMVQQLARIVTVTDSSGKTIGTYSGEVPAVPVTKR